MAMTEVDEANFLEFIRGIADVELLIGFASTEEGLIVQDFEPRQPGHWTYHIWNRQFPWKKEYGRVRDDIPESQRRGWIYFKNMGVAPLIEYTRHNFHDTTGLSYGRVYWSKNFTLGKGEEQYDFDAFSKWYDTIVRWIGKNGKQKIKGTYEPYFLPDAMKQSSY